MPIEDQPTLDRLLAAHQYHFGDISDWPNDICEILPGEMMSLEPPEIYFLGSLAACRHLRTHQETVPLSYRKVSVVLSFCPREMKRIRGQPAVGWKAWFEDLQIRWFTFDVDDPRTYLDDTNTFFSRSGKCLVVIVDGHVLRSSEALEGNDSARRTRHPLSLLRRGQPQLSGIVRVVDLSSSALRGSGCAELVDGPSHASPLEASAACLLGVAYLGEEPKFLCKTSHFCCSSRTVS